MAGIARSIGRLPTKGLNRSRGRGGFDQASERLTMKVLFRKLRSEAFRLVRNPEQNDERFHSRDFPAASTNAAGHAAAQAFTQDARGLRTRCFTAGEVFTPFTRYRHGGGTA